MALHDLLKPKVQTLEDWSPDVPRSRIDMDAMHVCRVHRGAP